MDVQEPGVVDRRVAYARVAPVDHAGELPVAHEQMRGTQVGVGERRAETGQRLDFGEEGLTAGALVGVE